MLADALEHLVRGIVAHPDDVTVRDKDLRRGRMLEVRVNPEDIGKVIGRSGRTATALRTVIAALAGRDQIRVDFVDVDKQARRGPSGRPGGGRRD
ncbi:MAG TPA: RNA-binding protein [Propionibacteriaceae bacterium]